MFSRIHEKLGTAGFVIAIVALIAALGGTALAAAGLNSKQKKEVTKIAKKYAGADGKDGAAGATGPQGPAGVKGDTGPQGKQGDPGAPGANGTDGEDGFCSLAVPDCVLPPGATLTGVFAANSSGSTSQDKARFAVSFPLEVPGLFDVTSHVIEMPPGASDTEECPGSSMEPKAKAGYLCLYEALVENGILGGYAINESTLDFNSGMALNYAPVTEGVPVAALGTWAVTAP